MRLIVTDNYYTSVLLAIEMLTMGCYSIGTVRTDRLVLPASLIDEKKNGEKHKKPPKMRTANIERGTSEIRARQISGFRALRWWDTIDVHDQLRLQSQVTLSYTPRSGGSWNGGCFDIASENSLTRGYTGSSGFLRISEPKRVARCFVNPSRTSSSIPEEDFTSSGEVSGFRSTMSAISPAFNSTRKSFVDSSSRSSSADTSGSTSSWTAPAFT
ncbi:Hypothetical protein PHPALM_9236 [Phytophthora palmivora]|uniref:PiggyBac transposable element-derived protein domain-containing protein n=1 Tax=Phytophthora palmivora TaxID=4796 RepID=A0A2P4Y7T0_9STRA|nr:Hypothetical protein PHPALM_9236 [Phytophthora palmivora]